MLARSTIFSPYLLTKAGRTGQRKHSGHRVAARLTPARNPETSNVSPTLSRSRLGGFDEPLDLKNPFVFMSLRARPSRVLDLSLWDNLGEKTMPSVKPPSPEIQSKSRTILLVEDEPILRAVLSQGLRQDGYTVLEAGLGKDALGICQQHTGPIDLLIADVVLPKKSELELKGSSSGVPELDGIEVARRVVALRPETRVIYISGHPKETWKPHRAGHPRGAFLLKPFDPESLCRKVREVLEVPAP